MNIAGIDHGHSLYEELLRVPLIVKLPGSTVKAEIEQTVSLESVLPTILDLCNIEFDRWSLLRTVSSKPLDGRPLVEQ